MFHKKTIRDVPLDGKQVLVRADYNVPLDGGRISDEYRLIRSVPTIKYLLERGCSVVVCSHLGRPDGQVNAKYSLEPVAARLGELLNTPVGFVPESVGERVAQATKRLRPGQVLLLENVRFHAGEEANDSEFARRLAKDSNASYFVQDGFGVVHRAHASTAAITQFLPSVAGLLLESEVSTILGAMEAPKRPLVAILGGAKISDKIKVIERFVELADQIIIGGAMANTFLRYKGLPVGKSLVEKDQEAVLDQIYAKAAGKLAGRQSVDDFIKLPTDVVVADSLEATASVTVVAANAVPETDYILDLGPESAQAAADLLKNAGTAIWNGTLGMAEREAYAHASATITETLATQHPATASLIGGGDTADFVRQWSTSRNRDFPGYISTGGGASLELMAGKELPGVAMLLDR